MIYDDINHYKQTNEKKGFIVIDDINVEFKSTDKLIHYLADNYKNKYASVLEKYIDNDHKDLNALDSYGRSPLHLLSLNNNCTDYVCDKYYLDLKIYEKLVKKSKVTKKLFNYLVESQRYNYIKIIIENGYNKFDHNTFLTILRNKINPDNNLLDVLIAHNCPLFDDICNEEIIEFLDNNVFYYYENKQLLKYISNELVKLMNKHIFDSAIKTMCFCSLKIFKKFIESTRKYHKNGKFKLDYVIIQFIDNDTLEYIVSDNFTVNIELTIDNINTILGCKSLQVIQTLISSKHMKKTDKCYSLRPYNVLCSRYRKILFALDNSVIKGYDVLHNYYCMEYTDANEEDENKIHYNWEKLVDILHKFDCEINNFESLFNSIRMYHMDYNGKNNKLIKDMIFFNEKHCLSVNNYNEILPFDEYIKLLTGNDKKLLINLM